MSSARQSLGRLNDALSFIPTVMTTSLATAPGTEATGVPAARLAQIEQVIEDELGDLERQDIAVQRAPAYHLRLAVHPSYLGPG